MSARSKLLLWQKDWAEAKALSPNSKGYLPDLNSNLFRPLSTQAEFAFNRGSGSELVDGRTRPAKMKALHSSSALAVNFFDSWTGRDSGPLKKALDLDEDILDIQFERQYPTGLAGNPPNLDVALDLEGGLTLAIESKFSEWLTPKTKSKEAFKSKYFESDVGLWASRSLPASEELARTIYEKKAEFRFLDVPQLLKHALGLVTQVGQRFRLWYVYLDWPGKEANLHETEIDQFSQMVGDELSFRALTYQQVLAALQHESGVDQFYLEYLKERYCRPPN